MMKKHLYEVAMLVIFHNLLAALDIFRKEQKSILAVYDTSIASECLLGLFWSIITCDSFICGLLWSLAAFFK